MSSTRITALPPARPSWQSCAILLVLAVIIVCQRLHTYSEPLERDAAGYAVIGHEMLKGRRLYSDLWERKPPLLYAIFAVAELLVGYGPREIFLLNISAAWLTMLGLYFAGRWFNPNRADWSTGALAAALWTIVSADLYTQANQPNAEVFINCCLTWAVTICLSQLRVIGEPTDPPRHRYLPAVAIGLLFAASTLFKQHLVADCVAIMVGYVFCAVPLGHPSWHTRLRRQRIIQMLIAAAVAAAAWGGLVGYFALQGRLGDFIEVLFNQNLTYAGDLKHSWMDFNSLFILNGLFVRWAIAPLSLVLLWLLMVFARRKWAQFQSGSMILLAWTIGTWLAISLPGHFFAHYHQLAIPVVCLAFAAAATALRDPALKFSPSLRIVLIAAVLSVSAIREFQYDLLTPNEWSAEKNTGNFVEQYQMAHRLNVLLRPNERFWNFGQDTTLYFATGKSPPTGLLYLDPLKAGPHSDKYWTRLMNDLRSNPPDLIVMTRTDYWLVGPDAPVFPWMHKNYMTLGVDPECPMYVLMVRQRSDLARRIPPSQPPR